MKTLNEMLELLQELDYVPGVSMAVPDFNYTVGKRRNFDTQDRADEFPYDDAGSGPQNAQGDGQTGVGRGGVGLGGRPDHSGGVREPSATYISTWDTQDEGADWEETQRHGGEERNMWRDTPEAKVMRKQLAQDTEELPEATAIGGEYTDDWDVSDPAFYDQWRLALAQHLYQHFNVKYNSERMSKMLRMADEDQESIIDSGIAPAEWAKGQMPVNTYWGVERVPESMGSPTQIGRVTPMDGPQHNVLNIGSSGSTNDMLPQDDMGGPANMWGGPGTIPGTAKGWANSPNLGGKKDIWKIPEEVVEMKLREFFNPKPVKTEPLSNPAQENQKDQTDEELEPEFDSAEDNESPMELDLGGDDEFEGGERTFAGRYGGETIALVPNPGKGVEFLMSPDKHGAVRGTYGMHMDGAQHAPQDLLDKRSAWDVLQAVIQAMGQPNVQQAPAQDQPHENPENEENPDDQD